MNYLTELGHNRLFLTTCASWILAQCLKVVVGVIRERRFNFRWLFVTGGMPSSHAAGVSTLATAVGMEYGFDSSLCAVAAVFAVVVMFDAQGVRRSSGRQAEILNKMLDDIYWKKKLDEEKLKQYFGHTPIEVYAGMSFGIIFALLFYHP